MMRKIVVFVVSVRNRQIICCSCVSSRVAKNFKVFCCSHFLPCCVVDDLIVAHNKQTSTLFLKYFQLFCKYRVNPYNLSMTKPTGRPVGRPRKDAAPIARIDGPYENMVSGLGSSRDSARYTTASPLRMFSEGELEALYVADGFARRIIDVPASDMVRAGFRIEVESEEKDAYAPVTARMEELTVSEHLCEALKLSWLYGGSLIVIGVMDGGELSEPLNNDAVKGIDFMRVYDRYRVSRQTKYTDPADSRYGQTQTYLVSPVNGTPYKVHESRCIVMQGEYVPERMREQQDGWSASRLVQCWYQLQRLGIAHMWSEKLLERSQQGINKMNGMAQQLMAPGGQQAVINRLNLLDMSRNIMNTVAIDAMDDYTVSSNSVAGVPDLLDSFATALSAVTAMPKTLLFGEQTKGLSNGGEGDLQNWYSQIKQWQNTKLKNPIDRIVTMLAKANNLPDQNYLIEFEPLYVPNEKDQAETDKIKADVKKVQADTASVYITAGALDPSEVRQSLIEKGDYIMDGSITIVQGEDDGGEA